MQSTSHLVTKFRLYTVAEVAELFPTDGKSSAAHTKAVAALIRSHGSYRSFGDTILLTESDVASLLRGIAVRGQEAAAPAVADEGHIVFIGSRVDATAEVFVTWCRPGDVDAAVREVQVGVPDVQLLDFAAAKYGDYVAWTESQSRWRQLGKWFLRTRQFNAAMAMLFATEDNDNVEVNDPKTK